MIEVNARTENPLLGRVEIEFSIQHFGQPTPDRKTMGTQASSLEPGSDSSLVILKNVSTRFGKSETTGLALIYSDLEHAQKEPAYIRERFGLNAPEGDTSEPTVNVPQSVPTPKAEESGGTETGDEHAEEE